MATYIQLKAQAEELLRQADEVRKTEIGKVVAEIHAKMAEYGIAMSDLRGTRPKKGSERALSVAAKYRDPVSGRTWSGRGLKPKWLAAYLTAGRKKDDFLI